MMIFVTRFASHDYKIAAAAPGITSKGRKESKCRKESSVVYLIKNEEHFFKIPPENFPLSQISLARVVSYNNA